MGLMDEIMDLGGMLGEEGREGSDGDAADQALSLVVTEPTTTGGAKEAAESNVDVHGDVFDATSIMEEAVRR
jgi:hypothetical protein